MSFSLRAGSDFYDLLLVDQFGPLADPFGTAPGTVAVGAPLNSFFDFGLNADLSSLVGQNITLFIDLIQEDDGFQTVFDPTSFRTTATDSEKPVVPEPATCAIWSVLCAGGLGISWWRRQRRKCTFIVP